MKVGVPRALFYWKKPFSGGVDKGGFWETFFENLGLEVLLSPKSNKQIVEQGLKAADPEACFATKVFLGHILWFDDQDVDYIFVPRLKTNEENLEYCPKFFGIPELSKILADTKILTETFDARNYNSSSDLPLSTSISKNKIPPYFKKGLQKLGKKFGIKNSKIEKAIHSAFDKEKKLKQKQEQDFKNKLESEKRKIILISHPYNLYDDYVNVGMKRKLKKLGAEIIFIDQVPPGPPVSPADGYPEFHWEFGEEIMRKIQGILNYKSKISGAIELSSFLCGCDAVVKEFVEKKFKQNKIPFLYLIIDEHTGDAGLQTRLEAFMDTLQ